jgi:hypothetical protein
MQVLEKLHERLGNTNVTEITPGWNDLAAILDGAMAGLRRWPCKAACDKEGLPEEPWPVRVNLCSAAKIGAWLQIERNWAAHRAGIPKT